MHLGYIIVYVPNVAEAVAFYQNAFGFDVRMITPEEDYAELQTGQTTLAFASEVLSRANGLALRLNCPSTPPAAIELAFVTEDVSRAVEDAISHGAALLVSPEEKPWGQTVAYLHDINGVLLEICTPL